MLDRLQDSVISSLERNFERVGTDGPPALFPNHTSPERHPLVPVRAREHAHAAAAYCARGEARQQVWRVNAAGRAAEGAPFVAGEVERAPGVQPLTRGPPQILGHDAERLRLYPDNLVSGARALPLDPP